MITVLIVDDLSTARTALRLALEAEPDIKVVAEASGGSEALRLIERWQPALVTMDLFLRRENGLDVAAKIMAASPRPILIVTSADTSDKGLVFRAVEAGVLDVAAKLPSPRSPGYEQQRKRLVRLMKSLSKVPVVRRFRPAKPASEPPPRPRVRIPKSEAGFQMLLIGTSTGGPPALAALLDQLRAPFPLPIAVVQHMAVGFMAGFADWLRQVTGHPIVNVGRRTRPLPGTVYLPPDDHHLRLSSPQMIEPSAEPPHDYQRPSVDILFKSAAVHLGSRAIGVILTGMGGDGSQGMLALLRAGALTIAQDPETCVVSSMPQQAIALGAVGKILALGAIGPELQRRLGAVRRAG